MLRTTAIFFALCLSLNSVSNGEETREVYEVEIEASVDDVWWAFSTTKGLQSWVAPLADIDFKVGGKWRANYNKEGKLGDETTIENTILAYDPKRMISIKATGFPKNFPFREAAKNTWSVFYFTPISDNKTKMTVVGLGYNDTEESKQMRSYFKTANAYSAKQLQAALKKKSDSND